MESHRIKEIRKEVAEKYMWGCGATIHSWQDAEVRWEVLGSQSTFLQSLPTCLHYQAFPNTVAWDAYAPGLATSIKTYFCPDPFPPTQLGQC